MRSMIEYINKLEVLVRCWLGVQKIRLLALSRAWRRALR